MRRGSFSLSLSPAVCRRGLRRGGSFFAGRHRTNEASPARPRGRPASGTVRSAGPSGKKPAPRGAPPSSPGAAAKRPTRDQQAAPPETAGKNGRGRVRRRGSKSRQDARTKNRQGHKMKGWSGALSGAGIRLRPPRAGPEGDKDPANPGVPVTGGPGITPRPASHRRLQRGIHAGNGRAATPVIPADRETFPGTAKTGRTPEPLRRSPRRDGPRTRPLNPTGA